MLAWPFTAACVRRTCAISMRSNQCGAPTQLGLCFGVLLSLPLLSFVVFLGIAEAG